MVERILGPVLGPVLGHRLLFTGLATAVFFARLLPLPLGTSSWPGPDILLCLVFCWTLRRPDYLPFWLVAIVIFVEDLLMMRPPGLWTALVLGSVEFLRGRTELTRGSNFGVEWVLVAAVLLTMGLGNRLILALTLLPQGPLGAMMVQTLATILVYPLVVGASMFVFGLRKPVMGETDAAGRRI